MDCPLNEIARQRAKPAHKIGLAYTLVAVQDKHKVLALLHNLGDRTDKPAPDKYRPANPMRCVKSQAVNKAGHVVYPVPFQGAKIVLNRVVLVSRPGLRDSTEHPILAREANVGKPIKKHVLVNVADGFRGGW